MSPYTNIDHSPVNLAMEHWTKVVADTIAGMYRTYVASAEIPDPVWPEEPFNVLLKKAFKDAFIDDLDHPVLQKLRGEV